MADEKEIIKEVETPKPPKSKKLLIIIAAVVIALGAGGFFFYFNGKASSDSGDTGHNQEQASSHGKKSGAEHGDGHGGAEAPSVSIVTLDPFIVNLQDNSGTRYLKLTMDLELSPTTSSDALSAQTARIRDAVIILLSSKSYMDIGTVEGKYQLRDEVVMRINQFLGEGAVKTAYFTEFVIQ